MNEIATLLRSGKVNFFGGGWGATAEDAANGTYIANVTSCAGEGLINIPATVRRESDLNSFRGQFDG